MLVSATTEEVLERISEALCGLAGLLRNPRPAQAVAFTGTAKYLRQAKAARIVADCGAGKTYMALGAIPPLSAAEPSTTRVMCPSHTTYNPA